MSRIQKFITAIFLGVAVASLVGCGSSKVQEGNSEAISSNKKEIETIEEEEQQEVVIGTSVAVVEILDRLGVELAGVPTSSYDLPESTLGAMKIGNPMSPDIEIIKSLEPTVVISTDTLGSDYEELFESNNIPSMFVDLDSVEGMKETIKSLAERFNKVSNGEEILAEIEDKENSFKDNLEGEQKDIMIVFAAPGGVSMLATEESYVGNLVKIAGGKNLATEGKGPFVSYNSEALSQMDPDMILVMTHAIPEQTMAEFKEVIATDIVWQNIKAVKEGKVEFLDSSYFGMSANLKVIESLERLKGIMYPEG